MIDMHTKYLGLKLKNPLVPSSSPLTGNADTARQLEDEGAAALVLPSLFEERVLADREAGQETAAVDASTCGSGLDSYLEYLQQLRQSLEIPLIASLNGVTADGWTGYAQQLQEAGADALELNVYYVASSIEESSSQVEQRYIDLLSEVKRHVSIPVTMKLGSQFSSVGHFVRSLEAAGADGVSLFNRFYQPDIALFTREVIPMLTLSSSYESLLRIHWVARLYGKVDLSLAVTGGIHSGEDALKALMAGADVAQLCSVLLREGPQMLGQIQRQMLHWLQENEYEGISQLRGTVSHGRVDDPGAYDRGNYVEVMQAHRGAAGLWR